MDNLTHSLFGLTLARTPLGRTGRGTTVALLLASNAPDIDILATAGGGIRYLQWHRGPTHGIPGILVLGLLAAALAKAGAHWAGGDGTERPAPLTRLWLVGMVGVACHVLMDLPTSYGTRPLSPFAWTWFAEDWLPIVDIYLLAILGAGLWLGRSAPVRGAAIALALMAANYGLRAAAHADAISKAPALFGAQLPGPCVGAPQRSWIDWWPHDDGMTPRDRAATRCLVEMAALPDFVSPFRWRLIAQLSNVYEVRDVDLLDAHARASDVRILAVRYPNQWTPAVVSASRSSVAQVFLGFSRFPAVRSTLDADGAATVRWADMRFLRDGPRDPRPVGLFGATVRVGPNGAILLQRLGP